MKKILTLIIFILIIPLALQLTPLEVIKMRTFDALINTPEESNNFVIVNITEEDVEKEGGYPLPRQRLAEITHELMDKGALGVGWVIAFPQADRLGGDEQFANALAQYPTVLAMFEDNSGKYPKTTGTIIKGEEKGGILIKGVKENLNTLKDNTLQGLAISPTEADQLVRRIPLLVSTPDGWSASFGTQIYKSLFGVRSYIITTNDVGIQEIAIRGIPPVKTDSLGRKWISWIDTQQTDLQEMNVQGRFAIVGVTASGVMPQIATPVGLLEPHKIQAALAESILVQDSPYIPDYSLGLEILIYICTGLLLMACMQFFGVWGTLTSYTITAGSTAAYGYWTIQQGLLINVTWTLISQFIVASSGIFMKYRVQYQLRQQIKKQFEHYLDPRQVKRLQDNPDLLKLGGERKYCTFLFTDVRGFTAMSEKYEPEYVTKLMNECLSVQQECVQKHGGMVDKYIGDAMMAIFGAPMDLDNHEERAVNCAIEMREKIKDLSSLTIGIGINTGFAVIGNMGSKNRFDYTAIGDAVNVAARLESGTKAAGVDLLIGKDTQKGVSFNLNPVGKIDAKGKSEKLMVYTWEQS